MPDDKSKSGGQDRIRINVNEEYEVRDWAKKFGVSAATLRGAVQAVGDKAEDVERHIKRAQQSSAHQQ